MSSVVHLCPKARVPGTLALCPRPEAHPARDFPRGKLSGNICGMPSDFRDVDPCELRVPPSRPNGADPVKLQRQIARFGASSVGMPPLIVYEGTDGFLVIY